LVGSKRASLTIFIPVLKSSEDVSLNFKRSSDISIKVCPPPETTPSSIAAFVALRES